MRNPNIEEKLKLIENELEKADSAVSYSGEVCRWVGLLVATFGTLVALAIAYETADRRALLAASCLFGGGLPLAAIGSIATNNKKAAKAALVQTQLSKLSYFDPDCESIG